MDFAPEVLPEMKVVSGKALALKAPPEILTHPVAIRLHIAWVCQLMLLDPC